MAKKKKVRVDMRKNRSKPARQRDWTRSFQEHGADGDQTPSKEQVRAKGELSRRRTIIQDEGAEGGDRRDAAEMPAVDMSTCLTGRVLRIHGLVSIVATEDGREFRCGVRRLLRTLATDERNIVATGDRVLFLPAPNNEGVIERVEPRPGLLTRASRGRGHVIVANA